AAPGPGRLPWGRAVLEGDPSGRAPHPPPHPRPARLGGGGWFPLLCHAVHRGWLAAPAAGGQATAGRRPGAGDRGARGRRALIRAPHGRAAPRHQARARVEGALVRGLAIRHDQRTATPAALIDELSGATVPRRRYSGGEVQEIVQRAAELEATAPTAGGAMTIGGVEALAAEVGIAR